VLSKELRDALSAHRRPSLWWNPERKLRRIETRADGGLDGWIGERSDGGQQLVRIARGQASLELLLNELEAVQAVDHKGLARLVWVARTGDEELTAAFRWRPPLELAYPLDLRWLLKSFAALGHTVGALHRAGWIHADLKPEAISWSVHPERLLLGGLHIAQQPGPRRFEAFSARYAAPEQVAGGQLTPSADVYALGVMLYSLFIRDRFPSILVPAGDATQHPGRRRRQAALSPNTSIGSLEDEPPEPPPLRAKKGGPSSVSIPEQLQQQVQQQVFSAPPRAPGGAGGDDAQEVLGAKVLFAMQLERVARRTADIGVAKQLLGVIEQATAQKPTDRYPDAEAFSAEIAKLLAQAEELVARG